MTLSFVRGLYDSFGATTRFRKSCWSFLFFIWFECYRKYVKDYL